MKRPIMLLAFLLALHLPPVQAEDACSAIKTLMAYEAAATREDAKEAAAEIDRIDATYAACKDRILPEDQTILGYRAATARESLEWPRSLDAAVAHIVEGSSQEDLALVAATKREDLIQFHMGWGMGIRNGLGLWRGNESLLLSACGGEPCHPDDASMKIIEAVWEHLQKHPPRPRK